MIENEHLKELVTYGIGIHHAGLNESDKNIVEFLFLNKVIQILICTSTLAWGINLPAYLVIIKGNEFFDPKTKKYKDISFTDLLQMMGRAGRPQFDDKALAILLVSEKKKNSIKNFLYHPMNIESNLLENINEHINAEISSTVINNKEDLYDYLANSYYCKRLFSNPSYYMKDVQYVQIFENNRITEKAKDILIKHMNDIMNSTVDFLVKHNCIEVVKENFQENYISTPLGKIATMYYIKCETVYFFYQFIEKTFDSEIETDEESQEKKNKKNKNKEECEQKKEKEKNKGGHKREDNESYNYRKHIEKVQHDEQNTNEENINEENTNEENTDEETKQHKKTNERDIGLYDIFEVLAQAREFDDVPLRHNEEKYNVSLAKQIPLKINMEMKNLKTYLLLLSRLFNCTFESVDFHLDLKLVMDQVARVINGFIDICLLFHKYMYIKYLITIFQCLNQRFNPQKNSLYAVKNITEKQINILKEHHIYNLKDLLSHDWNVLYSLNIFDKMQINSIAQIPILKTHIKVLCKSDQLNKDKTKEKKKSPFQNVECVSFLKKENKYCFQMEYCESNRVIIKVCFTIINKKWKEDFYAADYAPKSVQWFFILHDAEDDESISIKRANSAVAGRPSNVSFTLEDVERGNHRFTVYVHNDSFFGVDQELHMELIVE